MKLTHWFLPEEPDVVGLLRAQLAITIEGLEAFVEWADGDSAAAQRMADAEARGDVAKRELMNELRAAFVLPFEPEDVFALSRSTDWILDMACDLVAEAEVDEVPSRRRHRRDGADPRRAPAGSTRRSPASARTAATRPPNALRPRSRPSTSSRPPTTAAWRHSSTSRTARRRIGLRELYRRSSQIGNVVVDVAERLMYAVIKPELSRRVSPMKLYTCGQRDHAGKIGHPCGRAADALRDSGYEFEIETVEGYRLMPWTRRGKRDEIRAISGQENVPVLVTDDGEIVSGSGTIARWAREHPAG